MPRPSDDAHVEDRFRTYRASGDRELRNELIEAHRWIAVQCARRFENRGEPLDDLVQIAQVGVLKAVERFDPDHGVAFPSFAMPTVLGELRRHFRDATWSMRVPRRLKELHVALAGANDALVQRLGRQPKVSEIADHLGVTEDDVLEALDAGAGYRAAPLTSSSNDDEAEREAVFLGGQDAELERADLRLAVRRLLEVLPRRERTILFLRFFEGLTQSEIAAKVGTSQVHVSRLLRASLARLQEELETSGESLQGATEAGDTGSGERGSA